MNLHCVLPHVSVADLRFSVCWSIEKGLEWQTPASGLLWQDCLPLGFSYRYSSCFFFKLSVKAEKMTLIFNIFYLCISFTSLHIKICSSFVLKKPSKKSQRSWQQWQNQAVFVVTPRTYYFPSVTHAFLFKSKAKQPINQLGVRK